MKQIYYFIVSLRPKQWVKNIIVFIPLAFSGIAFNITSIEKIIIIFIIFSLFV